ncbi:MAG: hypothetical protein DWQ05_02965 [Calditrichaeota bacterium]|nr:MAG: hypothetical protein DWQ05_02965 [Calditrichota bacterium]
MLGNSKISGFSMGRNVSKLYYPVRQSIESILPIVDEFYFALGDSEEGDRTREEIEQINSDKVKIIDTKWDLEKYPRGMEHAHQTDIAKNACSGDWLFYLQADEVVHEDDLPVIQKRCDALVDDSRIEGFIFNYHHFWGDYDHFHKSHGWYKKEIRIIRNDPEIHSWQSAQSFRRIPDFDGLSYRQKEGTFKLNVATIDARIFHYGWVRPPKLMKTKIRHINTNHKGVERALEMDKAIPKEFDYGPLDRVARFEDTHPAVMAEWIDKLNWQESLQHSGKINPLRQKHKHETFRDKFISFLEQHVAGGKEIGGFKNYNLVRRV